MTTEFIPYEEALAIRQLGFNEPCMAIYYSKDKSFSWHHHIDHTNQEPLLESGEYNISAPLYQQAFRWFREKHKLHPFIMSDNCVKDTYGYNIGFLTEEDDLHMMEGICKVEVKLEFKIYEKAELECLKQLIKIVKEKK